MYSRESQNMLGPYNNWSWWITVKIEEGQLVKGDKIIITYGDTSFGEKGVLVQPWKEDDRLWFTAFADTEAEGEFVQAEGSPVICRVTAGKMDKVLVAIPSIVKKKEAFKIKASFTDWGWNSVPEKDLNDIKGISITDNENKTVAADGLLENKFTDASNDYDAVKLTFYNIKAAHSNFLPFASNPDWSTSTIVVSCVFKLWLFS
jgi:exosome complex RNA-binding protein Csl4